MKYKILRYYTCILIFKTALKRALAVIEVLTLEVKAVLVSLRYSFF